MASPELADPLLPLVLAGNVTYDRQGLSAFLKQLGLTCGTAASSVQQEGLKACYLPQLGLLQLRNSCRVPCQDVNCSPAGSAPGEPGFH